MWVDLEMTGLDPDNDVIIEVAALVSDFKFNILREFESAVYYPAGFLEAKLNSDTGSFWNSRPKARDQLLRDCAKSVNSLRSVEIKLIEIIKEHFKDELVILAGSSIRVDRAFIDNYMPELAALLHYRMFDVTSFKIWIEGQGHKPRKKAERHRALYDIYESMEELKFYLEKGYLVV